MGVELNFKDTYKANIAAYRLGKLLGLSHMIPPFMERRVRGDTAAVTWWIDDVLMTERDRFFEKRDPPRPVGWNRQMYVVRLFDQLIYNTDRNLGNLVIDQRWKLHMIDQTRAFRTNKKLKNPDSLVQCDRKLFTILQQLDEQALFLELRPYLTETEIEALLVRGDRIVALFEKMASEKGVENVFYDSL